MPGVVSDRKIAPIGEQASNPGLGSAQRERQHVVRQVERPRVCKLGSPSKIMLHDFPPTS